MIKRAVPPAQKLVACPAIYPSQIFFLNLLLRKDDPKTRSLQSSASFPLLISILCT